MGKSGFVSKLTKISKVDRVVEVVSVVILLVTVVCIIVALILLPSTIPLHFNGLGEVDRYGSKIELVIYIPITLMIYFSLTVFSKYPDLFNFPAGLSPNKRDEHVKVAQALLRFIKVEVLLLLFYIITSTIIGGMNGDVKLGEWFLPTMITVFIGTIGISILRLYRIKDVQ